MKIVVCVRTRNEEINIKRFCQSYQWADRILVADANSKDRTVELASEFDTVSVRNYSITVPMDNGLTRSPHGSHLNFLIDWAFLEEDADWIILDDCDCFPNRYVRDNGRFLIENTDKDFIYITRLYLWKEHEHFPELAKPNKSEEYVPSIWAWNKNSGMRFRTDKDTDITVPQELLFIPSDEQILKLMPPYALLHNPWQTEEMVLRKMDFYRFSGEVKNMMHPTGFGGVIEPLPEWAEY